MKKKILIALITLILITLIGIFYYFGIFPQTFIPKGDAGNVFSYTGRIDQSWFTGKNLIYSASTTIPTTKSVFRFDTRVYSGSNWINAEPMNIQMGERCWYDVKVYKDGQLLEHVAHETGKEDISWGRVIELVPHIDAPIERTYSDDGTIIKDKRGFPSEWQEEKKSGISVRFKDQVFSGCSIKHFYKIEIPKDIINIDISSLKPEYLEGETINLNVNIENNYNNNLLGLLKLKYEVETILGSKFKEETKEFDISQGEFNINYKIPIDKPTEELIVYPEVEVYLPTKDFSGANIVFEDVGQRPFNYKEKLLIGSEIEDPQIISIKQNPLIIEQDCKELGCPQDYTCHTDGTCIRTELIGCSTKGCPEDFLCNQESNICERTIFKIPLLMWISIGIIGIFIIIIIVLLIRKK